MQVRNKVLFDASALLALVQQETGYKQLEEVLAISLISSVNLSEVVSVLSRSGMPIEKINETVDSSITGVIDFTRKEAIFAGELITKTKHLGLSLGDRAAIATAILYGLELYTTDRAWLNLTMDGLHIVLARDSS